MEFCLFCKIASREIACQDIFFEDEKVFAMLDIDWAVKGHSLVAWKEHALNMSDLSEADFAHFAETCRRVEAKLLQAVPADKSIILKSGLMQPHFHFHVYPVKEDIKWESVKDIFDKKIKYESAAGEREKLLADLQRL